MQTKNLMVCNYNVNMGMKIIKKIKLINGKKLVKWPFFFLLIIICFIIMEHYYKSLTNVNNRNISVADFRLDINKLSEIAATLEVENISDNNSQINGFGSDGKLIKSDEITPDLSEVLVNIGDINKDKKISDEEMVSLGVTGLKKDAFQKKLSELQLRLESSDCNLENYVVITKGKYAGTILYNGPLKFVDGENKIYVGIELLN